MLPAFLRRSPARPNNTLLLFGVATALELISACNVVRLGERSLNRKLERGGLRADTARLGEANLHYWEGGEGRPVILLHGFGASAVWQWHEQAAPLARDHRVILPDLLWFGQSWSRQRDFSIDYQIQTVVALLDHLGIEEADFVGISYGGVIAHELAALYPERVGKLAILDSPGRSYTPADHQAMLDRFEVESVSELLVPDSPEDIKVLMELGYHKPPRTPRWVQSQVLSGMYSDFRDEKEQLLVSLLEELEQLDQRPGEVTQDTLLIWGREDPVFPLEIGERLAAEMKGPVELRVIDGAAHAPNLEHGALVARWLVEFFH